MKKTTRISALGGVIIALFLFGWYGTAFGQGQINYYTFNDTNSALGTVYQFNGTTSAGDGTTSGGNAFYGVLLGSTTSGGTFTVIPNTTLVLNGGGINSSTVTLPTQTGYASGDTLYFEFAVWSATAGSVYSTAYIISEHNCRGSIRDIGNIFGGFRRFWHSSYYAA